MMLDDIEKKLEKKALKRQRKKRLKMKMSGRGVKDLQKLIIDKSSKK